MADDKNGKQRVRVKHIYQNDPEVTFHPRNSNFKQAIDMTNNVIKHLKKKIQLIMFEDEIEKKIELGTQEKLSKNEIGEILHKSHHFW